MTETVEAPARRSVKRRRSHVTPQQNLALAVVVTLAAVAAALADAAPTGYTTLDLVYRVILAVGVTVAASRARRWSLVVGTALCVAGSLGLPMLVAAVAFIVSAYMVAADSRNRVIGSLLGALIVFGSLHLTLDWFTGSTTLLGGAAVFCVVRSGYRNTGSAARKNWRRAIVLLIVFVVAATVLAALGALLSAKSLEDAVSRTKEGVAAVHDGRTPAAAVDFEVASHHFESASGTLDAWWTTPAKFVPFVSQNMHLVSAVSEAGRDLTLAGKRTASEVDYNQLSSHDGGIDLAVLSRLAAPVLDASKHLDRAMASVSHLESPWLVGLLSDQFDEFRSRVGQLQREATLAKFGITNGPALLGSGGARRYLVLFGDPAEARDIGGHIGNWCELSVDHGHLSLVHVGTPLEISRRASDQELALDPKGFDPSLISPQPGRYPQNWGGSPDFQMDARLAADLYQRANPTKPVDGVLYADPYTLAAMLRVTGPMQVPGLDRVLRADGAVQFLTQGQFTAFATQHEADDSLTGLIRNTFDAFTKVRLPGPKNFADLFGDVARHGRLRFVSLHGDDHALLGRLGLDAGVPFGDSGDLLGVISRNGNPNKLDAFLHRSSTYQVRWDPGSGEVQATASVELKADQLPPGLPTYVVGNEQARPLGTNVTDLALISPFELTGVTVDGAEAQVSPVFDGRWWRYIVRIDVAPGQTRRVVFHLEGNVDTGDHYRLAIIGQPLLHEGPIHLDLTASRSEIVPGRGIEVDGGHVTANVTDQGVTVFDVVAQ